MCCSHTQRLSYGHTWRQNGEAQNYQQTWSWYGSCSSGSTKHSRKQAQEDIENGAQIKPVPTEEKLAIVEAVNLWVNEQMEKDRKVTALKTLQGHIWLKGYQTGELKGVYVFFWQPSKVFRVYDDVVVAFNKWREQGIDIYIYSSGSVPAQKLLFGYSDRGIR